MSTDKKINRTTSRQSVKRPSNPIKQFRYSTLMSEENFVTYFLRFCTDYDAIPIPQFQIIKGTETFKIIPTEATIESDEPAGDKLEDMRGEKESEKVLEQLAMIKERTDPEVTVFSLIYDQLVKLDAPTYLRSKGCEVNLFMLDALKHCEKKFNTLTTLRLQRCSINAFGIVQISEILAEPSCSIKDLNLDVNPNIKQNYHLLCAPGTNLLYLSLKLCQINDSGVEKIAFNLTHRDEPDTPKLIVLNLANNHICELGAKNIGLMLRTNRSLQSLTLTGNRINDAGAECILEQLSTITLTHEEVIEKRRRKLNRLKLADEKIFDGLSADRVLVKESTQTEGKQRGRESRILSKKRRASSRQVISNSSTSSVSRSSASVVVQSAKERSGMIIPFDTHPLFKDPIPVKGTLTSSGNFKLEHLNLSFNKITEHTLQRLINCFQKQQQQQLTSNGDFIKGLQHVNVEGNNFDVSCDLAVQFNAVINQRRYSK